jgi:hypothetical protein
MVTGSDWWWIEMVGSTIEPIRTGLDGSVVSKITEWLSDAA